MARTYKTIYEDAYKFHAKYGRVPPQDRDGKYWAALTLEMEEYSKAHGDKFSTDLLVAAATELEREYKGGVSA